MLTQEALRALVTQTMPYGKYKGMLLGDLPGHYLAWFVRQGMPKGTLGQLLTFDHNGLRHLLDPLRTGAPRKR